MNRSPERTQLGAVLNLPRPRGEADAGVRVLVAVADGLARGMMRFALSSSDRIGVVHAAGNAREALELARYFRPGVAIVDTIVPPTGGPELVRTLLHAAPDMRVLTVSVNDDRTAIAALRAGAVGHIARDTDPEGLAELVVRAANGEVIVSQRLMPALLDALRGVPDAGWRPLRSRLTTREWEIVELLSEGATTQRIADRLVLSPMTVYSHTKSILRKLGVNSRREAVVAAERLRREEALTRPPT
ncbi:MAG TPA: response regulator transcription factor [Solirubrobacteraceae bacterium]|nr:response regulator transcription factor [Solirubrobacteraceae bacterium]